MAIVNLDWNLDMDLDNETANIQWFKSVEESERNRIIAGIMGVEKCWAK